MLVINRRLMDENSGGGAAGSDGGSAGGTDSSTSDWRAGLPEPLREWDEVKQSQTPEQFADQMTHLKSKIGTGIYAPDEGASDEARQAYYEKIVEKSGGKVMPVPDLQDEAATGAIYRTLGKPANPEDYQVEIPEGLDIPSETLATMKGEAFAANLTQGQFERWVTSQLSREQTSVTAQRAAFDEGHAALKGEWGNAYDQRFSEVKRLAQTTGAPPELVEGLDKGFVNAATIKWLHGLSGLTGEGRNLTGDENTPDVRRTPAQAEALRGEIMRDRKHAYHDPSHPGHKAARALVRQLSEDIVGANNRSIELGAGAATGGTIGT